MNKFFLVVALAFCGSLSGCAFLEPPAEDPVPPKPKTPPIDFFEAADNVKPGVLLPGKWKMDGVDTSNDADSNELVIMRSVSVVKGTDGTEKQVPSPVAEKMRLAGIILPPKGAPGRAAAVSTLMNWTRGKLDLEVEGDAQYPVDLLGRRQVQVYFFGSPTSTNEQLKGKRLNLNRMMVRSGYAVVDLHQASSIEPQKWFNDEQYARLRKDPADPKKPAPLGLWKMGIVLGQRPPTPGVKAPAAVVGVKPGTTAPIGGATVITKKTTTTTTTKTTKTP